MHWELVGDLELPIRIGGHPALDFCNTRASWVGPMGPRGEWLRSYDHLAMWAWHAGLFDETDARRLRRTAARTPDQAAAVLTEARRFRTVLHTAVLDPGNGRALGAVAGQVRRAAVQARLRPGPIPRWEIPASTGLDRPLLLVARAAGQMLTSDDVAHIAVCRGTDCGWIFIDRPGRRRWCSMSSCGNRAKVAAYARRHRGSRADA